MKFYNETDQINSIKIISIEKKLVFELGFYNTIDFDDIDNGFDGG